ARRRRPGWRSTRQRCSPTTASGGSRNRPDRRRVGPGMTQRRSKRQPTESEDRAIRVAAREAGLRLVEPEALRIQRRRAGSGFFYVDAEGRRLGDRATIDRIRKLAIPP